MFENISRKDYYRVIGIYVISNDKYYYVGQSVNIYSRMLYHKSALLTGKHDNTFLQRVHSKYNDLEIDMITTCEKEELNDREKYFIENYDSTKQCMNLKFDIISPSYNPHWLGKRHKESSKVLMSEAKKGKSSPNKGKSMPKASIPIYCIDEDGVRTDYESAKLAAQILQIDYKTLHQRIKYSRTGRDGTTWFYNNIKVIEPVN